MEELSAQDREVVEAARKATANSYAVYSGFNVGAAVRLAGGTIVAGTNQENAAYPSGLCAERTTLFWANSQYPDKAVETLAIAARTAQGEQAHPITPCGACRQVMVELMSKDGKVYIGNDQGIIESNVSELMPLAFDKESL